MGTQKCTTSHARVPAPAGAWQPLLRRLVVAVLLLSLVVPVLSHATAVDLCTPHTPVLGYDSGGDGSDGSGDGGDNGGGGDGGGEGYRPRVAGALCYGGRGPWPRSLIMG